MDTLVSTDWLAVELGATDLVVLDATYFLPEHGRDAKAEYRAAHIPGALFLDLAHLSDPASPLPSTLPSAERFAAMVKPFGLNRRVVVYDASPLHSAARAWWMLRYFGHPAVAILDGGLARWRAENRPVESGWNQGTPATFHAVAGAGLRELGQVRSSTGEQIVDARSPDRFAGTGPEARPGVVPGHIPGSVNLHYAKLFAPDGRYRDPAELRAAFAEAGIDPDQPIVATCGSGITAASLIFALHRLGGDAALYDGSWTEWGSDPTTAKATGPA